jgi:hypothetical protein
MLLSAASGVSVSRVTLDAERVRAVGRHRRRIGWTVKWRLLKACNNACAHPEIDGLWVTGSQSGTLTHDDSNQDGPTGFNAGGSAWSNKFQINFPAATASWTVPPSNTIMLR